MTVSANYRNLRIELHNISLDGSWLFARKGGEEMDFERLKEKALAAGFTYVSKLNVDSIQLQDAVRDMCAANQCGQYGQNWSCPPACGSLDECRDRLKEYKKGILVQTVGKLEDIFDYDGMVAIEARHKEQFMKLHDILLSEFPHILPIGVGSCTRCEICSYPDEPCRMPDKCISSMEAYGMMVMQVCKDNGMGYYYGSDQLAYTSCYLLE